jgi:WASH complex subunit 7
MHKQSRLGNDNLTEAMLQSRCELLYQGLSMAGEISFVIKCVVNLHAKYGQFLSKPVVSAIYKLIESLRIIKKTYEEKSTFISDSIAFVFQYLQFHTLNVIGLCKKKIMMEAKKEKKFDLSTNLVLIEKLLYANVSANNLNSIALALNLTEPFKNFGNEFTVRLLKLLDHMMTLCRLEDNLARVCDPSYLFWHQNLIASNFKHHLESSLDENKLNFVLESLENCCSQHNNYHHHCELDNVKNFHPFIERNLNEHVVTKLCNSIEINLRLDFHSNLVEKFNPFDANSKIAMEDHRKLVMLRPIILNDEYISIQDDVEFYLSKMFYNLTTIALKDWRTYEEMRRLAQRKYSLVTIDDHLPTQSLEQGIDVLQIMRNIHLFVSRFNYNLNNQIFVESITNNNQHFNTIGINNIANSLATHGFGIISTTINFVYQFMRKKLSIFSQVMFNEMVKSRLARETKLLREATAAIEKSNNNNSSKNNAADVYTFERALALHDYIKNLEQFEGNQTLMDKIRSLISSIGNALGYIRMVKSGIGHVNSNSISYIPTSLADEDELEVHNMCANDKLSDNTINSAKLLEKDLLQAMKKIEEGSRYFKVCVFLRANNLQLNSHNSIQLILFSFSLSISIYYRC